MKLITSFERYRPFEFGWLCIDDDTYDGAEDAGRLASIVGHGATEQEAMTDYLDQREDYDSEMQEREARENEREEWYPYE